MRLIDADELEMSFDKECDGDCEICENALRNNGFYSCKLIADAPTVELDESIIQEVLNKKCMTAVTNEHLVALHGKRPQGEWARHDEWRGGEYIGGFYHIDCPCEDGYYSKWETNFCPNCGQPMLRGGAE